MTDDVTRWSQIVRGRNPDDSQYEDAWRFLYRTYSGVITRYFTRHAPDGVTAQEWADDFMACWVEGSLDRATPVKGRFRHYLVTALRHYRYRQLNKRKRQPASLDVLAEPASPTELSGFDTAYAQAVLQNALRALDRYQRQARGQGRSNHYHTVIQRVYFDDRPASHAELAVDLGLTVKAVERQIARARDQLQVEILAQLRDTVRSPDELDEEVQWLLAHCPDTLGGDLRAEGP